MVQMWRQAAEFLHSSLVKKKLYEIFLCQMFFTWSAGVERVGGEDGECSPIALGHEGGEGRDERRPGDSVATNIHH